MRLILIEIDDSVAINVFNENGFKEELMQCDIAKKLLSYIFGL